MSNTINKESIDKKENYKDIDDLKLSIKNKKKIKQITRFMAEKLGSVEYSIDHNNITINQVAPINDTLKIKVIYDAIFNIIVFRIGYDVVNFQKVKNTILEQKEKTEQIFFKENSVVVLVPSDNKYKIEKMRTLPKDLNTKVQILSTFEELKNHIMSYLNCNEYLVRSSKTALIPDGLEVDKIDVILEHVFNNYKDPFKLNFDREVNVNAEFKFKTYYLGFKSQYLLEKKIEESEFPLELYIYLKHIRNKKLIPNMYDALDKTAIGKQYRDESFIQSFVSLFDNDLIDVDKFLKKYKLTEIINDIFDIYKNNKY